MKVYRDTDYLYLSARLRARIGMSDALSAAKVSAAPDYAAAKALLGAGEEEALLNERLSRAFSLAREFSPDPSFIELFAYPYDCQNLKIALKYALLELTETPPLFSFGTVSPEEVQNAAKTHDFSAFPKKMAQAAQRALEAFAQSDDIQLLDTLLDSAALSDMITCAEEFGCEFITKLVRCKIDCYHMQLFARLKRIGAPLEDFLRLFAEGGTLSPSFFEPLYAKPLADFYRALLATPFEGVCRILEREDPKFDFSASEFQRELDAYYYKSAEEARAFTFGAEPVVAYLLSEEAQVAAIRRLLAEKRVQAESRKMREE